MWINCSLTDLHPKLLEVETAVCATYSCVSASVFANLCGQPFMYIRIVEEYPCECMPIKDTYLVWSGCWLHLGPWPCGSLISARLWCSATCSESHMHVALCVTEIECYKQL